MFKHDEVIIFYTLGFNQGVSDITKFVKEGNKEMLNKPHISSIRRYLKLQGLEKNLKEYFVKGYEDGYTLLQNDYFEGRELVNNKLDYSSDISLNYKKSYFINR